MSRSAFLRIVALALMWGCSFLFIKVALDGLSPTQVVLGRILVGAVTLGGIVASRRRRMPRDRRLWGHLLLLGAIANVAPFFLFAWGEGHGASSGLAGIYNATTPLWTLLIAMVALPQERPSVARAAGIVIGFLGVVVVFGPWTGVEHAAVRGQVATVGAALLYGVAFVYTRRFVAGSGHPPAVLALGQLACAAALMLLLTPFVATDPVSLPWRVVGSVIGLGAIGTGYAYVVYYGLIADVGATTASTVTYLTPIVAVALGVAVLDEAVHWNVFVGAVVVIVGVAVAEGRARPPSLRRTT